MSKKNGIVVDLDRITKREHVQWRAGRRKLNDDPEGQELWDWENLWVKVIVSWPYGDVTMDNYLDLTLAQATEVDQTVVGAINELAEKK